MKNNHLRDAIHDNCDDADLDLEFKYLVYSILFPQIQLDDQITNPKNVTHHFEHNEVFQKLR